MERNDRKRRLAVSLLVLVVLIAMCVLTAYAASLVTREVKNNYFQTGIIKINLNEGKAIIQPDEYLFEPGMTVKKDFFLRNEGTWDVYYKIYFSDIEGALKNVLEVTITDKNAGKVLYSGLLGNLTQQKVKLADDVLPCAADKNTRDFTISFHFPEERGNETQERTCSFVINAMAVQTKNNPNKEGL